MCSDEDSDLSPFSAARVTRTLQCGMYLCLHCHGNLICSLYSKAHYSERAIDISLDSDFTFTTKN